MSEIEELTVAIREFSRERDWEGFHTPKNLAMALSVEVAELAELLQWLTPEESALLVDAPEGQAAIEDEIAAVATHFFRIAAVPSADSLRRDLTNIRSDDLEFPRETICVSRIDQVKL
jgi:NTP pyrophosphatase (non-canonical NTP hydrolase)